MFLIRRETAADHVGVHDVTVAAFPTALEAGLVGELRADAGWLPRLSLVAEDDAAVVGHVVCTRGHVDGLPALGLGPISVRPDRQRQGIGSALMHAVLGAADALDEPAVVLLGDPAYYARFGFRPASTYGITPPVPDWEPYFQVRELTAYTTIMRGRFTYAEPFSRL